jgi:glycosyltransferase involved in cell wall biosynthesis
LAAYERFRELVDDRVLLVLAGPSAVEWRSDLDRVIEWQRDHPRLAADVRISGYVATNDLAVLFRRAAVCATATRDEGFGLTVLQSMAAGTPAVAPPLEVFREFAEDLAWYADPVDQDAYAHALLVACAVDRADPRVVAARERAATFTWEQAARRTTAVYHRALA